MTTKEHLDKIVAKIDQLLELADKRTQGKWDDDSGCKVWTENGDAQICYAGDGDHDNAFIASCAGPAEAGWSATKAAIQWAEFGDDEKLMKQILDAWPEELL